MRSSPRSHSLRVAFCIDNMEFGGTELNALRTAPHLLAAGVELTVISLTGTGPLIERYEALGVPIEILPLRRLFGRASWHYGMSLARTIRQRKIQVVHAHDFYSNIFAAPWARLGGAAFLASRRWWEGPDRRSQRIANRASYMLANGVLANSESVGRLLVEHDRVSRRKVTVIPNFVDDSAFLPPQPGWIDRTAASIGLPAHRIVVGTVANLSPVKDQRTLLSAVATLASGWPALHVVLVGRDGGSQRDLENHAALLGIADRAHFPGFMENLPSPHHLFDVSTLTSVSEGMPNSIIEAMAAGKPVVATAVGAVPDAVLHGVTGLLLPPSQPTSLAKLLESLLQQPGVRVQFGEAGRSRARASYSRQAAVSSLLSLYHSLADS